jgi:SAM-dependent methyltransferase
MTDPSGGYVTDIEYIAGYFRYQSPAHLATACLMSGVACDIFDRYDELSYVELGCGQGFGAMVLAASNPGWTVTAIDFNAAHIAGARAYASAAGLANITFLEADLATLAEDPQAALVPEADVVSLHGVWSWVPETVRDGITRLLRRKLRPGGLVHLSYNALPAWQSALGMQRLVREAGLRLAARSDRQVQAGFEVAKALDAAEAEHLHSFSLVRAMLERSVVAPVEYLAHEYMNACWSPCFHADVARTLAGAKLEWAAAAELIENFPELAFTDAQRAVAERFDDPIICELIKDTCLPRGLRQDVFVRGARRLGGGARNAALGRLTLMLTVAPEDFQYEAQMPTGRAEFGRAFYGAVVEALSTGPKTVAELASLPGRASATENPAELLAILLGSDQATIVIRPEAVPDATACRFNAVTAARLMRVDRIGMSAAMASVRLGAGLHCPLLELYVLDRGLATDGATPDAAVLADQLGAVLEPDERNKLRTLIVKANETRAPVWRAAGVI